MSGSGPHPGFGLRAALSCAVAATIASLGISGSATASTRYATPEGSGPAATCPQSNPCSLDDAVEAPAAGDGDDVILATGLYQLADGLDVDDGLSVGGAPSAVPVILAVTPGEAAVAIDDPGADLHDVTLIQLSSESAIGLQRGRVERVTAQSVGDAACSLGVVGAGQSLIRDSVCWSAPSAVNASAVEVLQAVAGARAAILRNVTAWASGTGGEGITAEASGGGTVTLDARNVIASGDGFDVSAAAAAGATATVTMTSSNYSGVSVTGAGTRTVTPTSANANQTGEPQLIDPDNGDFDEVIGSPTIDAGSVGTLMGDRDIGGTPRVQGPQPDIGADERDGTAPRTSIDSGPGPSVRTGRVTFAFSSNEPGSKFECQIDDADFRTCSSPHTTDTLAQGDHVFRVRATDPSGNVEATPAERSFTVDKVIQGANAAARTTQKQKGSRLSLVVTVKAAELARVRAAGTVKVGKKRYRVESKQMTIVAGQSKKLRLTPKDRRAGRKVKKALKKGDRVEAVLAATFIDLLGNRATSGELAVRVK